MRLNILLAIFVCVYLQFYYFYWQSQAKRFSNLAEAEHHIRRVEISPCIHFVILVHTKEVGISGLHTALEY